MNNDADNEQFLSMRFSLDDSNSIEMTAKCISAQSSRRDDKPNWAELYVYVTQDGTFIGQSIGATSVEGQKNFYHTCITRSAKVLKQFFGNGELSRKLLSDINLK